MFLKFVSTGSLLLLLYNASVKSSRFKFQIDDIYQPFVVNIQFDEETIPQERRYRLFAPPPTSSTYTEIEFVANTYRSFTNLLISTCADSDRDPDYPQTLYQNQENVTSCSQIFRPSMFRLNDDIAYGVDKDGIEYSVGYSVEYIKPHLMHEFLSESVFVGFYEIIYSHQNGLHYTRHVIHPGTEITLNCWILSNGNTLFKSYFVNYPTQYDESLLQLVPFEDLIPMPWKIGTLLDINFIQVSQSIKDGFHIINKCLRNHVNTTRIPLTVLSGVMDNAWYWKMVENGGKAVLISITTQDADDKSTPCTAGGCGEFGLGMLENQISNIFCCEVTQRIAKTLNLVSSEPDSEPDYMIFEEKLILSPSV